MFLAYTFQYDLVIKLVDTSARIFNCFVSTFVNIALCPISIRYLCHIVFYNIIPIILYQPSEVSCLMSPDRDLYH